MIKEILFVHHTHTDIGYTHPQPVVFELHRRFIDEALHIAEDTAVNGLPWGVVDALLDHGISGLSMAINEHFGHALRPWPRAFRWQSPSGRELIAYNGFIYGVTSDLSLKIPVDFDEAR